MQVLEPKIAADGAEHASEKGLSNEEVFVFPVTVAQRRFWMLDQLKPGNPALNFPLSARLQGRIDRGVLEAAMNEIIRRHEILRTSFRTVDGEVVQVIHKERTIVLDWHDVSALPEPAREAEVERLRLAEAVRPFSLTVGPLLRAGLIKVKEDDYVLLLSMHHIACDGMSNGVLIPEVARTYTALIMGLPLPPELPLQYADFAQWQNEWLTSEEAVRERDYWQARLKGTLPTLNLPTDRPRRVGRTHSGTINSLLLPKSLTEPLKDLCRREDATFFMMILAVYGLLLYRYTGNPDIIIGSPAANRNQTDLEGLIGLFTNPLLMRMDFSGNPTLRALLARVKQLSLDAFANQAYPFEKLAEELTTDPHRSGVQWLQAYFVFQKAFMLPQQMPGATLIPLRSVSPGAMFEWLLGVVERAEGVRLQPEYNTDLYDSATIDRMLHHFRRALETFVANPDTHIDQLDILTPAERQQLVDWNTVTLEIPEGRSASELFEEQVRKSPNAIALHDGQRQLSYDQLNRKANQLANYLRAAGVKSEERIGLAADPGSIHFVIGYMSVLKAGGCCVLLDPNQGSANLERNISASSPILLLTDSSLPATFHIPDLRVVNLETEALTNRSQSEADLLCAVRPEHAACVRFSAGRSGPSKGAVINHHALVNAASIAARQFGLGPEDRVGIAPNEVLPALLKGACLVVQRCRTQFDPAVWRHWVRDNRITVATLPIPCWHEVVRQWPGNEDISTMNLRVVAVGGDNISPAAVNGWNKIANGRIRLVNCYNLAEMAAAVAYTELLTVQETSSRITVSRPAPDTRLCILDSNLQPVPVGVPGDIYVGGSTLASGFLNGLQVNTECFIAAPAVFNSAGRLLKTGDRGRLLAGQGVELTGRVEELGRTHGFRLELCELRGTVCQHRDVWDTIIETREEGEKSMVVHVVAAPGTALKGPEVLSFIKERLPAYMLPAAVVVWKQFPLGADGLVDRRALAAHRIQSEFAVQNDAVARNSTEAALVNLWKNVLKAKRVGIHDNFFDLGGDSLAAAILQTRIEKELGRRLPLAAFFQAPTVDKLQKLLADPSTSPKKLQAFTSRRQVDESPVFVFHFLFMAHLLANHLGPGWPVYGVESRLREVVDSVQEGGRTPNSLETLAKRCVEDLQSVQPRGPYNLAGFCFGGLLAFEVANQLTQMGERVGLLALLNSYYGPRMGLSSRPWLTRLFYHFRQVFVHRSDYLSIKLGRKFKTHHKSRLEAAGERGGSNGIFDPEENLLFHHNLARQVIRSYRGKPVAADVVLFRAVADPPPVKLKYDPAYGWKDMIQGELRFEDVLCGHSEIVQEPWIGQVATRLQYHLSRSCGGGSRIS